MTPCKYGHTTGRSDSDNRCIECRRITNQKAKLKLKENDPQYYIKYSINNKNTEASKRAKAKWKSNNRGKVNSYEGKRRASKIYATPRWLTKKDLLDIKTIYETCPEGYHVDHDIPLRGRNVCGLHVPSNLKQIPSKENLLKSNRF